MSGDQCQKMLSIVRPVCQIFCAPSVFLRSTRLASFLMQYVKNGQFTNEVCSSNEIDRFILQVFGF